MAAVISAHQLAALLLTLPDLPVLAEWEGTLNTVVKAAIKVDTLSESKTPVIIMHVDGMDRGHSERVYEFSTLEAEA